MPVVHTVENFSEGDFACIRCGKPMHLYFNGGEFDLVKCCGLEYSQQAARVDLIVFDPEGEPSAPDFR
jgi:hypothetical protein